MLAYLYMPPKFWRLQSKGESLLILPVLCGTQSASVKLYSRYSYLGSRRYYTQTAVLDKVPKCFLMLGIVFASVQLVATLLVCIPTPPQVSVFGLVVVRLQEIPSGSIYKNSSKNRAKLSLVFEHF